MRIAVLALILVGCGRLGFDAGGGADSGTTTDTGLVLDDADVDSAVAVCGNATCEGTLGEVCATCADCNTMAVVCGNGACEAGEDGTSCYVDCGPASWPWGQDETDLVAAVNAARTGGTQCPGDTVPRFAAALTTITSIQPGAREYAWEMAFEKVNIGNGASCNGRTFAQRQATWGANGGLSVVSTGAFATMTEVVEIWRQNSTLCPFLMNTTSTQIAGGVAHDAWHGHVVWFK